MILANESKTRDAVDVKVLVHFVMDDNRLIGSATTRISDMAADSEHALGGELTFPGGAPIARLRGGRRGGRQRPCHADEARAFRSARHAEPSRADWCGSIEGELQNASPTKTVQSVQLSAVVLDDAGNIIGGGSGYSYGTLPPGGPHVLQIATGMRPIPVSKTAIALVSVVPTYQR